MNPIQTQEHVIHNRRHVFPEVGEVGEQCTCVAIAAKTLQSTPDTGEGGEETEEAGVPAVALRWGGPVVGVEAEEEFDVLGAC